MDSVSTFVTSSPRAQREVLAAALLEKRRRRWRVQPSAFVRDVLGKPKLWIKGSEDELEQLAGHRPAAAATA